jgi:hypothetical protein
MVFERGTSVHGGQWNEIEPGSALRVLQVPTKRPQGELTVTGYVIFLMANTQVYLKYLSEISLANHLEIK